MSTDHVKDSVRDEFSKLSLDGKTSFLVEAIFSTAGSAINEIGSRLTGLVALVTEPFGDSDNGSEPKTAAPEESGSEEGAARTGSGSGRSRSRKTSKSGSTRGAGGPKKK